MKRIVFLLLLLITFGLAPAQIITKIADTSTLRSSLNTWIVSNGAITAQRLNILLNGQLNVMQSGDSTLAAHLNLKQPLLPTGIVTQYMRADLTIGNEMTGEIITGSENSNIALLNIPLLNSVKLLKNGIRLPPVKYSVSGLIITLTDARITTDIFHADYKF